MVLLCIVTFGVVCGVMAGNQDGPTANTDELKDGPKPTKLKDAAQPDVAENQELLISGSVCSADDKPVADA